MQEHLRLSDLVLIDNQTDGCHDERQEAESAGVAPVCFADGRVTYWDRQRSGGGGSIARGCTSDVVREDRPGIDRRRPAAHGRLLARNPRIDTYAGSSLCDFDSDLRDAVLDAMDQVVMAEGVAELEPNRATIHILHLSSLRRLDTAEPKSLDGLAQAQGVTPVRSVEDLRGAPTDDMDGFLAALRSARGEGESAC